MEPLVIVVLIAINGFFALSEIAFVSSRRELIEAERDRGSKRALLVLQMMDTPDRFLSSMQVGITLIGVISGVYGGVAIADDVSKLFLLTGMSHSIAGNLSLFLIVGVITYLSIVLGELVPKTIALKKPETMLLAVIPTVTTFSLITYPIVSFLSWSTRAFLRIIGMKSGEIDSSDNPLQEILGIAKAAAIKNKISREQAGIITQAARLSSTRLNQIMVKRSDIRSLSTKESLADALVAAHIHHHTRFPLVDSDTSDIIGYINFKDIVNTLRLNPANPSLRGICRPMASFAAHDTVNAALRRLISTHQHIALVRDSQHGVVGLVTMEDILETIVGDIQDEYDTLPDHFYEIAPGRFVAGGGTTLQRLRPVLGAAVPDENKSLDRWIREHLGTSLKVEMVLNHDSVRYIVRKVSRSHIYEVIIERASGT